MATQIANSMNDNDKQAIENMDMEQMISHVTKNVFKMMNNQGPVSEVEQSEDSEVEPENIIYPKTRDICFDLNVDLEDFYTGKKKKLNVKRKKVIEVDGKQKVIEEKIKIVIPIEKGMKDEQQIRFPGEADQIPGYKPGDIIINLIENEHEIFQRDSDNLIMIKNINFYQIYDLTFEFKHLDNRIIRVTKDPDDSLHLNESFRKISNEGMPVFKENDSFGDLFIRFNIILPRTIEPSKLSNLKDIFECENIEELSEKPDITKMLENVSETDLEELESDYSDSDSENDSSSGSSESSESSESEPEPEPEVRRRRKKL